MADGNNVLNYPQMARQREENIQAKEIAYAEDVNAELNYIMDTFNQLVAMLTGEWGDGTGRIYDLVDDAVSLANQALVAAQNCVQKTGDTMTGHLNIALVPASDYNVVNKKYVDDTIDAELAEPINRITTLENWKENLDATQVKLSNANFSGTNVNDGMNELFISVSNGKAIVAAAITGKGVETASDASFKTMADNINAILTFTEGTSGGTATAQDIMYGKTAYARNSLIVGNYIPLDTSDATASPGTIAAGYTAYVNGQKITGIMQPYPTFGTDTSNATATAADIAYGKTAYARGQMLVGTATGSVEEVYGISAEDYDIAEINDASGEPPDGADAVTDVHNYAFSQDGNYCVRNVLINGTYYVESFAVNNEGLYYQGSKAATTDGVTIKKYRYTYEELGLDKNIYGASDLIIGDIAFGCPGFGGDENKCILAITFITSSSGTRKQYIRFLTYHLSDNGIIGLAYDGEINYIELTAAAEIDTNTTYNKIVGDLTNPMNFYCLYSKLYSGSYTYRLDKINIYQAVTSTSINYLVTTYQGTSISNVDGDNNPACIRITEDNRYCCFYTVYSNQGVARETYIWDIHSKSYPVRITNGLSFVGVSAFNNSVYGIQSYSQSDKIAIDVFEIKKGDDGTSYVDESTVRRAYVPLTGTTNTKCIFPGMCMVTNDGKRLICVAGDYISFGSRRLKPHIIVIDMEEVMATPEGVGSGINNYTEVSKLQDYSTGYNISSGGYHYTILPMFKNKSSVRIYIMITTDYNITKQHIYGMINAEDTENIVAVIYKNEYFSKVQPQTLSAGGPDVRAGKTFIGWQGYPETGTMEV